MVEYACGSPGSSLAFVRAVKGYPLRIVSSDAGHTPGHRVVTVKVDSGLKYLSGDLYA